MCSSCGEVLLQVEIFFGQASDRLDSAIKNKVVCAIFEHDFVPAVSYSPYTNQKCEGLFDC